MGDYIDILGVLSTIPGAQFILIEIALALLTGAIVYWLVNLYTEGEDWRQVHRLLVAPKARTTGTAPPSTLYRRTLERFMGWLDGKLNPEAVERGDVPTAWSRAWGWRLYDRCLLLSLVYPLIFIFVQWGISEEGIPGRIGDLALLNAEASRSERIASLLGVSLLIAYTTNKKSITLLFCKFGQYFGMEASLAKSLSEAVFFSIAGAFAFTLAIALSIIGLGAIAFAFIAAFAFVAAFTISFVIIGAFAYAYSAVFTFTFTVAIAVVGAGIVVGAGVSFLALNWIFERMHARHPVSAYIFLITALLIAYGLALIYGGFESTGSRTPILFYGLLPLVNAQFDFLSMTATRLLLRRGLQAHPLWHGSWDVMVGGICFLLLCFTAVAIGAGANALAGPTETGNPLIDLPAIFAAPAEHGWLFVAFLTTLLPTFAHLTLALFSLGAAWPERVRHWCAARIEAHHKNGGSLGNARLARAVIALMAGGCVLLCALAVHGVLALLYYAGLDIGAALLNSLEGWHGWLIGSA